MSGPGSGTSRTKAAPPVRSAMSRNLLGLAFALAGVGSLAFALAGRGGVASVFAAMIFLLVSATKFSVAGRLSGSLRELVGERVVVTVWGEPIAAEAGDLVLASVAAFGAGLLLRLRPAEGARKTLLKVAQPRGATSQAGRLVIESAAYVQWAGVRLPRHAGRPAVILEVRE